MIEHKLHSPSSFVKRIQKLECTLLVHRSHSILPSLTKRHASQKERRNSQTSIRAQDPQLSESCLGCGGGFEEFEVGHGVYVVYLCGMMFGGDQSKRSGDDMEMNLTLSWYLYCTVESLGGGMSSVDARQQVNLNVEVRSMWRSQWRYDARSTGERD